MVEMRELTLTDKKKLEAELADLVEQKKQVAEDIKTARGFGDLSENAEYDAAKKEEARVYGRIEELEQILSHANFIDDSATSTETVAVGTVVKVYDADFEEEVEYTIVGFTEANPMENLISADSPIGAALIGGRVGDTINARTPGGVVELKILNIRSR